MLKSTIAKVTLCIGWHISCSRRRARRPRTVACSRTAADTLQALARAIAFLSVSCCKIVVAGTIGRRRLKMGCWPCRRQEATHRRLQFQCHCLDAIHAPIEDAITVLLW